MESLCSTVPKSDAQIRSHCPELNFDPDFGKKKNKGSYVQYHSAFAFYTRLCARILFQSFFGDERS